MTDVFSKKKRSAIMSRVRGKNTSPEIIVRKVVHSLGYRFRLHKNNLPGKPDLILPRHQKIILVHGCFWHGHANCHRSVLPTTNITFWSKKILGNKRRDTRVIGSLRRRGWKVLVVWQCQTKKADYLTKRLKHFLQDERP